MQTLEVQPDKLIETIAPLKQEFNMLLSVSGVDTKDSFAVIYHFYSTGSHKKLCVKVPLTKSNPEVESLCSLYSAANWHEREAYDLFGINFLNHPNMERLLMPADWIGHPLRKDYVNNDERLSWNER